MTKTSHPFLASQFPNFISSEVIFKGVNKFVIYSDDTSRPIILGMGINLGAALDEAEATVKKMD